MKKFISILLAVLLGFGTISVCAETEKNERPLQREGLKMVDGVPEMSGFAISPFSIGNSPDDWYNVLRTGMREHRENIDLSGLMITPDELLNKISYVLFNNADIMAYTKWSEGMWDGTYMISFKPVYIFETAAEDEQARNLIEDCVKSYIELTRDMPQEDIAGKILVIHDKFIKDNAYAYEAADDEEIIHTAYGAFKNKRSVCQGIAIALNEIYKQLDGIENTGFCTYEEKNGNVITGHIWNLLKINGKWYHLDATWDDMMLDKERTLHNYFLVSSDACADHNPEQWDFYTDEELTGDEINSKKYENGYIFNGIPNVGIYACMDITYDSAKKRYVVELTMVEGTTVWEYENVLLYSGGITSYGMIVSEPFTAKNGKYGAMAFANTDYEKCIPIYGAYEGTVLKRLSVGKTQMNGKAGSYCFYELPKVSGKMFLWADFNGRPNSEPIYNNL